MTTVEGSHGEVRNLKDCLRKFIHDGLYIAESGSGAHGSQELLAMKVEDIGTDQSLSSYGADSLVAAELRNWVSMQLEAHVEIFELMSGQPIHALARLFAGRSHLVPQTAVSSN